MKKKLPFIIIGVVILGSLLAGVYLWPKKKTVPLKEGKVPLPTETLPTKTPEEIEIISKVKTHQVKITATGFVPASLTIKKNDQVAFKNEDTKTHQITGEGWGGVPINPGEVFSQTFTQEGSYPYSCSLHPELKGEIIVK